MLLDTHLKDRQDQNQILQLIRQGKLNHASIPINDIEYNNKYISILKTKLQSFHSLILSCLVQCNKISSTFCNINHFLPLQFSFILNL